MSEEFINEDKTLETNCVLRSEQMNIFLSNWNISMFSLNFIVCKDRQFDILKCCRHHRKAFQDFSSWIKNMIVQDNFHATSGDLLITTLPILSQFDMMTSSNGNIFRVTGPLCGEFTVPGEFPTQKPVTRSFDVFFDLRLNKRLSKQPWAGWFETLSWSLWRHCNDRP